MLSDVFTESTKSNGTRDVCMRACTDMSRMLYAISALVAGKSYL